MVCPLSKKIKPQCPLEVVKPEGPPPAIPTMASMVQTINIKMSEISIYSPSGPSKLT